MFKSFEHWMKIVRLYESVILDLSSITGFKDIIVNHCYKFFQSDAVNTRNHIDFNFPYFLKGLIFSFWLQEYDTNLWERETEKKNWVAEITCSHFCSNIYCLIDVHVLTKPTVLWIFIDLFNFWSLLHMKVIHRSLHRCKIRIELIQLTVLASWR